MPDVLSRAAGWVDRRERLPSAADPARALTYFHELRARGYKIDRRGFQDEEAYRLRR